MVLIKTSIPDIDILHDKRIASNALKYNWLLIVSYMKLLNVIDALFRSDININRGISKKSGKNASIKN